MNDQIQSETIEITETVEVSGKKPSAKQIYKSIWSKFAKDRKDSRAQACANLQRAICEHAADLVPDYFTAKEHLAAVMEVEEHTKQDKQSETGDPLEAMSSWLRGDLDLSRTPLEVPRKH
jgi:hypothetical protein